ncbi:MULTISPECIES: GntR family transcriptional regulator [Rhodomicrobium]|uniref:GntR family transcriptional regulator n=1 Tax=Rhodomicrobium TaxID=1068 RepID=UPI000B4B9390|nr:MULTISPECIES: GntR family transcriptional regulator [Rhodomicrobium]
MQSITQQSLHDELLGRLRKMIISGAFLPGDKIPERQLCDQFGVSRTPLREALKVLAAEGLVQLAPNRGAMIATLSADEMDECLTISSAIEALSAELACANITDDEIEAIKGLHDTMIAHYRAGNLEGFLAANREIHESIVAAARNPLLAGIYDTLFFRIGRTRVHPHYSSERLDEAVADHEEIISVLEARQGKRLAELLQNHLEHLFDVYRGAPVAASSEANRGS